MIQIITLGDISKIDPQYKCTCPKCGCVFKYNYSDLINDNNQGGYQMIICPTCDNTIVHNTGGSAERSEDGASPGVVRLK